MKITKYFTTDSLKTIISVQFSSSLRMGFLFLPKVSALFMYSIYCKAIKCNGAQYVPGLPIFFFFFFANETIQLHTNTRTV